VARDLLLERPWHATWVWVLVWVLVGLEQALFFLEWLLI
jgi:hypothetical protein